MKTSMLITKKLLFVAIGLLLVLPVGQALAADITVDADCSLPNAIRSANGDELVEPMLDCEPGDGVDVSNAQDEELIPGLDTLTIDVSGTHEGMIALDATLAVSSHIVIDGQGFSVNGGGNQIFSVTLGSLTIKDLTMSNGFSVENGGAISVTGGSLTLTNSAVRASGARGLGGGIYALDSDVTLTDSVISSNVTAALAENYLPVEIIVEEDLDTSQTDETEGEAQTVDEAPDLEGQAESTPEPEENEESEEEVVLPEVDGSSGGGIYFAGESSDFVMERSGVDSNTSPENGGGVYIASGSATIGNSTISGNSAGADGGGLYNSGASILTHVTIVGNTAANGGGIVDASLLQLYNSILSENSGGDCVGSLNANLGNLIKDGSCNHDGLTDDPMLLLLAGSPAYYLPQENSPVVDAAVAAYCSLLDQRSIDRLPESCDIGAAQYQAGVFSFQIQSALAALTPGAGGGAIVDEEAEESEELASTPAPSNCGELPGHIMVTGTTPSINCTMLDWAGVGNQTLVDGGALYAVDVFGWVDSPVTVCFKHDSGAIVLLDAANSPRDIVPLRTYTDGNRQCASVDREGSAVFMPLEFFTSGAIAEPIWDLTDCKVTTTDILNLRQTPASDGTLLANVLNNVELTADQKATLYYRVNYYGIVGWLSKDYLSFAGTCA